MLISELHQPTEKQLELREKIRELMQGFHMPGGAGVKISWHLLDKMMETGLSPSRLVEILRKAVKDHSDTLLSMKHNGRRMVLRTQDNTGVVLAREMSKGKDLWTVVTVDPNLYNDKAGWDELLV